MGEIAMKYFSFFFLSLCCLTAMASADDFEKIVGGGDNPPKVQVPMITVSGISVPKDYHVMEFSYSDGFQSFSDNNDCISFVMAPQEKQKKVFISDIRSFLYKPVMVKVHSNKEDYNYAAHIDNVSYEASSGSYKLGGCNKLAQMIKHSENELFVNKTQPEILAAMLDKLGIQYKFDLKRKYEPREFTTRLSEVDYNFFRRIMDELGLFYVVRSIDKQPTFIFVDDLKTLDQYVEEIPFSELKAKESNKDTQACCNVSDTLSISARTGFENYVMSDYDLEHKKFVEQGANEGRTYNIQKEYQLNDYNIKTLKQVADTKMAGYNGENNGLTMSVRWAKIRSGDKISLGDRKYYVISSRIQMSCYGNMEDCDVENRLSLVPENTKYAPSMDTPVPMATSSLIGIISDDKRDEKGRLGFKYPWMKPEGGVMYRAVTTAAAQREDFKKGDLVLVTFVNGFIDRPVILGKM